MSRPGDRINSALNKHGYAQVKKIGEGSFGAAILVQHESERAKDTKAIVKMIDISRASKQEREDALKESQVLASLKHPYIVRYRESFDEEGWLCIVMDYCEGGDLSDRVKKMRQAGKSFSEPQVLRWFTQSILALKYIHDMHILHRDLKSGNFFLSKSGNIKMGDFGIAKVLECTAACAQTQIGTPYYLSPEICQGKAYNWASDIWSMGCILYEMSMRRVPFDAQDLKSLIQKITRGPAPDISTEYSANIRNLCKELLERDPARRPPAAEILKKPVVREMVRRMLDEVKAGDEGAANAGAAASRAEGSSGVPASSGAAAPAASGEAGAEGAAAPAPSRGSGGGAGHYAGDAGTYTKGQAVEYWSETHGEWLPASVTNVNEDGRIMLNVKPNVWLSRAVQGAKVRPKGSGGQAPAARGPSAARAPAGDQGGRSGGAADPGLARNGSREAMAGGGRNATPGRDRDLRAPSARRDPSGAGSRAGSGNRR